VTPRFDVCIVGSANLDLVAGAPRIPKPGETVLGHAYAEHPGGKGLNQAVAAARSGASVCFVAALGADPAGERLRQVLADEAIDAGYVITTDIATGRALIVVADDGENAIVVVPGANRAVVLPESFPTAAVVLVQREVPDPIVAAAISAARRQGALAVLNPAPAATISSGLIAACDVIVPNQHEVDALGGVDQVLAAGCGAVVVTRGGDGVDVHTRAGVLHVPAFAVDVVDTTGAGDAFCGSLAARLAAGEALPDAVRWAAAAGALATTIAGAVPAQPSADRIRALLEQSPLR
jgi:ribokinase